MDNWKGADGGKGQKLRVQCEPIVNCKKLKVRVRSMLETRKSAEVFPMYSTYVGTYLGQWGLLPGL